MSSNIRLTWQDKDWAAYLGCSVGDVKKYKKILDQNYVISVGRNTATNLYGMRVYRYDLTPSGEKRLRLLLSSKAEHKDILQALSSANDIISKMELNDFIAEELNMPAKAIQMMLIREK